MLRPEVAWRLAPNVFRLVILGELAVAAAAAASARWEGLIAALIMATLAAAVGWAWASVQYLLKTLQDACVIIDELNRRLEQNVVDVGKANMIIKGGGPDPRKGGR